MIAPSEKHLEDWIVSREGNLTGAPCEYRIIGRQIRLNSGVADLLIQKDGVSWLYELKKECIDAKALAQILRYRSNLRMIFARVTKEFNLTDDDRRFFLENDLQSTLIGHSVEPYIAVAAAAANVSVHLYEYDGLGHYEFTYAYRDKEMMSEDEIAEYAYGYLGEAFRRSLTYYPLDEGNL